ncbi:MAG: hypothetical protein ACRDIL_07245 [Candidatus Limnocylindrales bacterium]
MPEFDAFEATPAARDGPGSSSAGGAQITSEKSPHLVMRAHHITINDPFDA